MIVEEGKRYRTRDGRSAGPMRSAYFEWRGKWQGRPGTFSGGGGTLAGETWGSDGGYGGVWPVGNDSRDLVKKISKREAERRYRQFNNTYAPSIPENEWFAESKPA